MKLFLNPGACSLGPHIALHELALDHDIETVQIKRVWSIFDGADRTAVA